MTKLQASDHIVIIGYFALLAGIGLYFWKRMRNAGDFFAGDNSIPWWLAGLSFYMTGFSAFTFVAYSEMAYRYGFVAVTLAWSAAVAMAIGTVFLSGRWRRARILSPVEFLEARYNKHIRQMLAWTGLPLRIIDDGLKIYATGVFVSAGLGYDLKTSIIASGLVMLLYTLMGGLWAVVVTDYLQFIVLTLGVLVLFPMVLLQFAARGGLTQKTPIGFLSPINEPFSLLYVIAFYLLVILSYNGNWALAQKFYCVRDEREARKTGMLAAALMFVGPPLFILPAMAARSLMPELMQPPNSPQLTYAALTLRFLPAGLVGLMIAAMFSATMSTLSGDYNVMASVITQDIYCRLFDQRAKPARLVLVGRLATALVGAMTVVIGVNLMTTARTGLFEAMVTLFGFFVGPMLIPMLLGLLNRRITWRGAVAGFTGGFASGLSLYFYKTFVLLKNPEISANWLKYDFEAITILTNFSLTLLAILVTSFFEKRSNQDKEKANEFFARLATPIEAQTNNWRDEGERFSPFNIVGWVTAGTGLLLLTASSTQAPGIGLAINVMAGVALCLLGVGFFRLDVSFKRKNRM